MTLSFAGLEAVFRLGRREGTWSRLSDTEVPAPLETTLETFASLCELEVDPGHEVAVEYQGGTILALCTPDEVVVAVARGETRPNKLVMRAAVKRVEVRSRAGRPTSPKRITVESDVPPESGRPNSARDDQFESSGGASTETREDHPPIEFDIVFDEEPVSSTARQTANDTPNITWAGLARFVAEALKASTSVVGQTVACNYWRQALRSQDLEYDLDVDFRGRVDARIAADQVPAERWLAFELAHENWLERVRQISDSFDFTLDHLTRGARIPETE